MEQPQIDPIFYQGMQGRGQDFSSIQFQLDPTQELEDLRAEFLGLEFDEEKQEFVKSNEKMPMMNSIGANAVMSFLKPRVNKIFSLSFHDADDIDKRCRRYIDDLTIMLVIHKKDYKVISYAITDNIIDLCDDIFRATVLKSLKGWEGEGIRGQQSYVETKETIHDLREPKKSIGNPFPLQLRRRRRN